ncbi:serine/threonine-protein kinase pim-1-like [Hemibagrus wyckioides]|uniref:serine/threonine-protein kinase pim-1-like n=1 Tax=Hemibagrus wyckioides TaxID=337641 RepID=UPI00266C2955|nr:serine/threonine-protein kinase pim-1-like [Hemibagrus wyckioides]
MNEAFITTPGETNSLPLEVALMQMVSKPYRHENVLELIEWFEMSDCFILILEQPSPCIDLQKFLTGHKGRLSETLAHHIMRQVVQAARHCSDCGVLHCDIKPENILINTDTLQLKLIDFGCGDLLQDSPYRYYAGTEGYFPAEWLCEGEYLGSIWSLGVLLFDMVCGHLPFQCMGDIVDRDLHFVTTCLKVVVT